MLLQNYMNKSYKFLCLSFTICPPSNPYNFFLHLLKKAHNVQVPQLTLKDFKGGAPTFQ